MNRVFLFFFRLLSVKKWKREVKFETLSFFSLSFFFFYK